MNKKHRMICKGVKPSGYEEWYCPECGYWFLMQWPPEHDKIVLEYGDDPTVYHYGARTLPGMSLEMGDAKVRPVDDPFFDWVESRSDLFSELED